MVKIKNFREISKKFIRNFITNYFIYEKVMKSRHKWRSQQIGSAVDSDKDINFPASEHKLVSKAGVKPIQTAVCVLF